MDIPQKLSAGDAHRLYKQNKGAGISGAGRQRNGVVAILQKLVQYEPLDKLRANGVGKRRGARLR